MSNVTNIKKAPDSPARTVASAAAGLSPLEAAFVGRALSTDKIKKAVESLLPEGTPSTNVDVTVRFTGQLARGEGVEKRATARLLTRATLALLFKRLGVQRKKAMEVLQDVLTESAQLGEAGADLLLAEHPEIEEAFEQVTKLASTLPPVRVAGAITLANVRVERVA